MVKHKGVCKKCKPWVDNRHAILKLIKTQVTKKNRKAFINKIIEVVNETPLFLSTNREVYLSNVLNYGLYEAYELIDKHPEYFFQCLVTAKEQNLKEMFSNTLKQIKMTPEQFNKLTHE